MRRHLYHHQRSTPADTGISRTGRPWPTPAWVYPRGHGDLSFAGGVAGEDGGLPPRTRGSLGQAKSFLHLPRSTPADTGISPSAASRLGRGGVYPRGHGDLQEELKKHGLDQGLPPRTRGSRGAFPRGVRLSRSTPADTGISPWSVRCTFQITVYPRGHGDLNKLILRTGTNDGLPPRTRGSPLGSGRLADRDRSTPADTGISSGRSPRPGASTVYPRGHGDLFAPGTPRCASLGLPPRTRGSRRSGLNRPVKGRSTPADTGISAGTATSGGVPAVYPRGHGDLSSLQLPRHQSLTKSENMLRVVFGSNSILL